MLGLQLKALKPQNLTKIKVDTMIQEKSITFPIDVKLHYKAIEKLGEVAKEAGIDLRQSYVRVAKENSIMMQRY